MWFWIVLKISFSKRLPILDKRIVGHTFGGYFGVSPGFCRVVIFSSFEGAGKWPSRRQWLHKCGQCTRVFLENGHHLESNQNHRLLIISRIVFSLSVRDAYLNCNGSPAFVPVLTVSPINIVTCMSVTINGVWVDNQIYWTFQHTTHDYSLQITVTHRLAFWVCYSLP
jgi:hypothetical protein